MHVSGTRRASGAASRRISAGAVLAVLGIALTTACSGSDSGASASGSGSGSGSTRVAATQAAAGEKGCLPAGDPAASVKGGYGVGQAKVTFVDHTRATDAVPARHLARKPDRTIPVIVSYPAVAAKGASPTAPPVPGASPAPGRFPLVVFSHGVTSSGAVTAGLVAPYVRQGYVVVTPTYPLSSGPTGTIMDLPNQPADVSFVITSIGTWSSRAGTPLAGHVQATCVAIAGHSLGAATTLAAAYLSCCRDHRVKAVISMSGVLAPFKGTFADNPRIPLLLLHGDQDKTVPLRDSQTAFAALRGPRYLVTLHGADHITIFRGAAGQALAHAVVGFLDAYLKGDVTPLHALPNELARSGVASYRSAT